MSEARPTPRDDAADFREHPEWFSIERLAPPANLLSLLSCSGLDARHREEALNTIINPPIILRRKPIPFVLPIRGSAL